MQERPQQPQHCEGFGWPSVRGCLPRPGHSLEGPSLQHPSIPAPQPPALTHKHTSAPLGLVEPLTLLGWGGGSRRRVLGGEGRGHRAAAGHGGRGPLAGGAEGHPQKRTIPVQSGIRHGAAALCRLLPSLRPSVWGYGEHSLVQPTAEGGPKVGGRPGCQEGLHSSPALPPPTSPGLSSPFCPSHHPSSHQGCRLPHHPARLFCLHYCATALGRASTPARRHSLCASPRPLGPQPPLPIPAATVTSSSRKRPGHLGTKDRVRAGSLGSGAPTLHRSA